MKNIWIDGYEANVKDRLGSGIIAYELLKNIEKVDKKNNYTIILPGEPLEDLPKSRLGWNYKVVKIKKLWTRIVLPWVLFRAKIKPDVFFTPTHYIPKYSQVKRVATIFDLAYLHFPQMFLKTDLFKLTNWSKYSIENSAHLVTISNSTKKDIQKNYNIPAQKITVAYPGYNQLNFKPVKDKSLIENTKNKYNIKGDYIIFIGTVQPRKNLKKLIEAVAKIENIELAVIGKIKGEGREGWMYQDTLDLPKKLGVEGRIKFLGFVPEKDMVNLLAGALVFVLPSLWEGFGIPAVESMATGIPVIASNVSSLPEVLGDAGLLVNPESVDQIEQAIRTVISDKKLRQRLIRKSLVRADFFSWKKMAKTVIRVLESV